MSAVSLLSSREKPSEESPKDGLDHEGHDEEEGPRGQGAGAGVGVAGVGAGGGGDPAVLCVGPARRPLVYTVEELLRLRNSPLVKRNLDTAFIGCEALALVLKRRSDSPNDEDRGARGDAPAENHKGVYGRGERSERRSADPRERVRKESESGAGGIVLSPQRRSFTLGCAAPAAPAPAAPPAAPSRARPESPLPAPGPAAKPDQSRRIGSGRIMVRDSANQGWEEGEWGGNDNNRPQRNNYDRFERRSYGRDNYSSDIKRERDERFNNEKTRDRERFIPTSDDHAPSHREESRRSGGRYQRRYDKEDEPEWFSGGPTSQHDTIELRGFDEPTKKNGAATTKETEKESNKKGRSPECWRSEAVHSPEPKPSDANTTSSTNQDKDSGVESKPEEPAESNEQPDFNLDEFLKFDSIPDVLTNGSSDAEGGGSRFSRWFRRDSPTSDAKHYETLLHNIVDDLDNSTRIDAPSNPGAGGSTGAGGGGEAHVFAPISPGGAPPSLLELLRRANANAERAGNAHTPAPHSYDQDLHIHHHHQTHGPPTPTLNSMGGKIHSLEELEARLRPQPAHAQDHDLSAFKRLLAQVSGGHAVPAAERAAPPPPHPASQPQPQHTPQHAPQPMSLLQMLNKSVEAQQKAAAAAAQAHAPHIPQELLYKLLQVQQRQQQQQQQQQAAAAAMAASEMNAAPPAPAPPAPALSPADAELLQRPEAQAIIHGLKAGEITVQHLMQQLGNPGLAARHRDLLLTILRLHHHQRQQMGGSPLPGGMGGVGVAAAPAHLVVPPHHQPLRLSPLPHPGVPARIPSPRELAAHTQSIMQGALIKKKLEEQRENYRRRHEHSLQPKQQTPISFTPTSVLRKMTAEKDSEAQSPKQQQWAQPIKMPQGRPIVKGNQSGAGPTIGYAGPTPVEYQQHYLNQQQQMAGSVRQFPHPQQRQQIPTTFNNMSNMGRGMPSTTSLHQLLVQSHQRSLNEMSGGAAGGGDNQLARWFSPELLARAQAGKLPSVHVPNALSLEDLERHHHSPAPPVRN